MENPFPAVWAKLKRGRKIMENEKVDQKTLTSERVIFSTATQQWVNQACLQKRWKKKSPRNFPSMSLSKTKASIIKNVFLIWSFNDEKSFSCCVLARNCFPSEKFSSASTWSGSVDGTRSRKKEKLSPSCFHSSASLLSFPKVNFIPLFMPTATHWRLRKTFKCNKMPEAFRGGGAKRRLELIF